MEAIILAGGQGKRLRQRVPDLPKPMALIEDRPFMAILLDQLVEHGVNHAILSIGYRGEAIRSYFGNNYRGMHILYSGETEPLGTGGALAQALQLVSSSPVLVLNGDTYLDLNYSEFFVWYSLAPAKVAMTLRKMVDASRYGSVFIEGETVIEFKEKGAHVPGLVNAGVYLLARDVFADVRLPPSFSLEKDFLQPYCAQLQPRAYISDKYFIDIGVPEDFEKARRELSTRKSGLPST